MKPSKKILVVDDEKLARDRILRFIGECGLSAIVEQATNGVEALDKISTFLPDIVFLDIQMPGLTGFEVLAQLNNRAFQLIFQTAYDEFAIKAFEENACDYLLKPFSQERFEMALNKALKAGDQSASIQGLLKAQQPYFQRVTFKQNGKTRVLDLQDVIYFLSQDHVTCAFTADGSEHILDHSLSQLGDQLDPRQFVRTHRKSIVAVKHIRALQDSQIELSSGVELELSRSNRARVKECLTLR